MIVYSNSSAPEPTARHSVGTDYAHAGIRTRFWFRKKVEYFRPLSDVIPIEHYEVSDAMSHETIGKFLNSCSVRWIEWFSARTRWHVRVLLAPKWVRARINATGCEGV